MSSRAKKKATTNMPALECFAANLHETYTDIVAADAEKRRRLLDDPAISVLLNRQYDAGYKNGFLIAGKEIVKCCYAGIVLALQEKFGFDDEQLYEAIKAVDEKTIYVLNHSELSDSVLEQTGLELLLDEPFDRVQKTND